MMKSTSKQLSKIMLTCMDKYSKSTVMQVVSIINSHEDVFKMEKLVEEHLSEQDFLNRLREKFPET